MPNLAIVPLSSVMQYSSDWVMASHRPKVQLAGRCTNEAGPNMRACTILLLPVCLIFQFVGFCTQAGEILFGGYTWTVRSGHGGPGPNAWEASNVWLDSSTNLHLKISQHDGKWSCAEITMRQRLGLAATNFK
jgi:hypothetical protein